MRNSTSLTHNHWRRETPHKYYRFCARYVLFLANEMASPKFANHSGIKHYGLYGQGLLLTLHGIWDIHFREPLCDPLKGVWGWRPNSPMRPPLPFVVVSSKLSPFAYPKPKNVLDGPFRLASSVPFSSTINCLCIDLPTPWAIDVPLEKSPSTATEQ